MRNARYGWLRPRNSKNSGAPNSSMTAKLKSQHEETASGIELPNGMTDSGR